MKRTVMAVMISLLMAIVSISAKSFPITVQKGSAEIVRSETGEQHIVSDTGTLNSSDMLSLIDAQQAFVTIEKNTVLLVKGPATLSLIEMGNLLTVELEDGQILFNRKQPYEFSTVSISSKKYSFLPMGTCAAVKTSKDNLPTTAVVSGKIRMKSPAGEAIVVEQGNFGSVGSDGKLSTGALSPRAIESLNEWLASVPATASAPKTAPQQSPTANTPSSETASTTPATTVKPSPTPAPQQQQAQQASSDQNTGASQPTEPVEKPQVTDEKQAAPEQTEATATPKEDKKSEEKKQDAPKDTSAKQEKKSAQKVDKTPAPPSKPKWEISAGTATINNQQWTRLALGVDVPLWKFGIFFDLELFIDNKGKFSDKGWNFKEDWVEALSRKIRYIRFGQENDPLFIKFGGLSSVTMGYGFIVDRFTNMLHYPDQKLLGLQFDLNDLSPIGITLQTLVADFKDFNDDGGILAARLAFRPLKMTSIPVINGISFGGTYAIDLNQYAPARNWDLTLTGTSFDRDEDGIQDSGSTRNTVEVGGYTFTNDARNRYIAADTMYDTIIEHRDQWASREEDDFSLVGGDIGIPIITTQLVNLDLYGQAGLRGDGKHGWGIGAPGIALSVWKFWANLEYRRVQGRFLPGYFNTYYLDERLHRDPIITIKEERLASDTLNGVFGRLGFNIANVLLIEGSYQYMVGQQRDNKDERFKDQRFEAIGSLGDLILEKVPKLNRAEVYYYKTRIGIEEDNFFEKTPYMYFGYRAGFEIAAGASLIFDTRYGYMYNENGDLVSNNNISIQTAITF